MEAGAGAGAGAVVVVEEEEAAVILLSEGKSCFQNVCSNPGSPAWNRGSTLSQFCSP